MLSGTREERDTVGLWDTPNALTEDIDLVHKLITGVRGEDMCKAMGTSEQGEFSG